MDQEGIKSPSVADKTLTMGCMATFIDACMKPGSLCCFCWVSKCAALDGETVGDLSLAGTSPVE